LLDPALWIDNSVVPFRTPFIPKDRSFNDQREINQQKVEQATMEWRNSSHHKGEGDHRFWLYALALRAAGMTFSDIEHKLKDEAQYGRSPDERRSQIQSVMKSLQQAYGKTGCYLNNAKQLPNGMLAAREREDFRRVPLAALKQYLHYRQLRTKSILGCGAGQTSSLVIAPVP